MYWTNLFHIVTYFIGVCLLSIALLVFVNASTPFLITDIIGKRHNIGKDVGLLGFADELLAMFACPVWGFISDKIGSRQVVSIGYLLIALALLGLVHASDVVPGLLLTRLIFSVGGAALATMVTAVLPSVHIRWTSLAGRKSINYESSQTRNDHRTEVVGSAGSADRDDEVELSDDTLPSEITANTFSLAGIVGTAAGCGALLAVFGFLRMPARFLSLGFSSVEALRSTFYIVASLSIVGCITCFLGLRDIAPNVPDSRKSPQGSRFLKYPLSALRVSFTHRKLAIACLGGFVARASSVGISAFIPLWVNAFYIARGECRIDDPANTQKECADAYKTASIITGISQLAALLSAPVWGFASSRYRRSSVPTALSAVCGFLGYIGISQIGDPRMKHAWSTGVLVLTAILIGVSQVGAIVSSLGLLGTVIVRDKLRREATGHGQGHDRNDEEGEETTAQGIRAVEASENEGLLGDSQTDGPTLEEIKGSISGIYSFSGGIGILILTQVGGWTFDTVSQSSPFIMLAAFNMVLLVGVIVSINLNRQGAQ